MRPSPRKGAPQRERDAARDRIRNAAYQLFSRRGVREVGVDEVIATAGVAKATFYRHYPSKDHLIVTFLRDREDLWTKQWLEERSARRSASADERLLVIFDMFDEWFHRRNFEGCAFVGTVAQFVEPVDAARIEAVSQLQRLRGFVASVARHARLRDPDSFAKSWQVLMEGSIVMALAGDRNAARRARAVGAQFLESYPRLP